MFVKVLNLDLALEAQSNFFSVGNLFQLTVTQNRFSCSATNDKHITLFLKNAWS